MDIELSTTTNSKEVLPQFGNHLELEIKVTFLWAIGQSALTEMTKTVIEQEPSALPLKKLYTLFRLHFTPETKVQHSRADFFDLKRETNETAAEDGKELRIRDKNSSQTHSFKIPIIFRKIYGGL